jgi:hypothetical protein
VSVQTALLLTALIVSVQTALLKMVRRTPNWAVSPLMVPTMWVPAA